MDWGKRRAAARLTQRRYDRRASSYDRHIGPMERLGLDRWRQLLWQQVRCPRVLELGVGTGASFAHYPPGIEVVAVDFSPQMLARAQARQRGQGAATLSPSKGGELPRSSFDKLRTASSVELALMDAEFLALAEASFDEVVTSCVFCSVADPVAGLAEVRRVLRPGGRLLMLEHGRSRPPLGWLMDLANPVAVRLSGANINRDTVGNLRRAGLEVIQVDNLFLDIVKLIQARAPQREV